MHWERVEIKARPREELIPGKSPGRKGGKLGPGKKWGHTLNAVNLGKQVYVFGGYGKDERQTNDVFVYNTVKEAWSKPNIKGTPPSPRDSHTCTAVGSRLFVFGGTDGTSGLNDLYMLETTSNTWIRLRPEGAQPSPREGHAAARVEGLVYIFGGCGKAASPAGDGTMEETYYNDVHIFNPETYQWANPTPVVTSGTPPSPRDSHSCCSWGNKLIVFGGEDSSNCYLNDCFVLDTSTMTWRELQVSGVKPLPRAGHVAVTVGRYMVVFGGFTDDRRLFNDLHVLDLATAVWQQCNVPEDNAAAVPTRRFSLSADLVDAGAGKIMFYGGCNDDLEALEDCYFLQTGLGAGLGDIPSRKSNVTMKDIPSGRDPALHVASTLGALSDAAAASASAAAATKSLPMVSPQMLPLTAAALPTAAAAAAAAPSPWAIAGSMLPMSGPSQTQKPMIVPGGKRTYDQIGSGAKGQQPNQATGGSASGVEGEKKVVKFEARIVDVFHFGYCLRASVDGVPLEGLLISYNPKFAKAAQARAAQRSLEEEKFHSMYAAAAVAGAAGEAEGEAEEDAEVDQQAHTQPTPALQQSHHEAGQVAGHMGQQRQVPGYHYTVGARRGVVIEEVQDHDRHMQQQGSSQYSITGGSRAAYTGVGTSAVPQQVQAPVAYAQTTQNVLQGGPQRQQKNTMQYQQPGSHPPDRSRSRATGSSATGGSAPAVAGAQQGMGQQGMWPQAPPVGQQHLIQPQQLQQQQMMHEQQQREERERDQQRQQQQQQQNETNYMRSQQQTQQMAPPMVAHMNQMTGYRAPDMGPESNAAVAAAAMAAAASVLAQDRGGGMHAAYGGQMPGYGAQAHNPMDMGAGRFGTGGMEVIANPYQYGAMGMGQMPMFVPTMHYDQSQMQHLHGGMQMAMPGAQGAFIGGHTGFDMQRSHQHVSRGDEELEEVDVD